MIICSDFDGDDDEVLQGMQHDVYGDALFILVSECNRYARFAKEVMGCDGSYECWGQVVRFDHRTLQAAHDLLAAVWRYRHGHIRQTEIPNIELDDDSNLELLWLNWLRGELRSWIDDPHLVRSTQLILLNQNEPIGYAEETRLGIAIMDRYSDIPWRQSLYQAFQEDLERKK